jgi:hypothetical protein
MVGMEAKFTGIVLEVIHLLGNSYGTVNTGPLFQLLMGRAQDIHEELP